MVFLYSDIYTAIFSYISSENKDIFTLSNISRCNKQFYTLIKPFLDDWRKKQLEYIQLRYNSIIAHDNRKIPDEITVNQAVIVHHVMDINISEYIDVKLLVDKPDHDLSIQLIISLDHDMIKYSYMAKYTTRDIEIRSGRSAGHVGTIFPICSYSKRFDDHNKDILKAVLGKLFLFTYHKC